MEYIWSNYGGWGTDPRAGPNRGHPKNDPPHPWFGQTIGGDNHVSPNNQLYRGGRINEPVFGFGLNSGESYSFGEKGPEMVAPIMGGGSSMSAGKSTKVEINIHIGNVSSKGDILQMGSILSEMLESKSRRGII